MKARFSFDPALAPFLKSGLRGKLFERDCARAATLKNAIEALGVPHTEVGPVRVNGEPATLQRIVREGDYVEVEATKSGSPDSAKSGSDPDLRFVADAHLGGLARFLRMLGFDTLHRNAFDDEEIRRLADAERRIVLTRDRELLKCREIARGAYVRSLKPEAQLREVADRFGLAAFARPFTLCLRCNLQLKAVDRAAVAGRVAWGSRPTCALLPLLVSSTRRSWISARARLYSFGNTFTNFVRASAQSSSSSRARLLPVQRWCDSSRRLSCASSVSPACQCLRSTVAVCLPDFSLRARPAAPPGSARTTLWWWGRRLPPR